MSAPSVLKEEHRLKLDGIVKQAEANGETPETIQFIVNDFKSKYGTQTRPARMQGRITDVYGGRSPKPEDLAPLNPMATPGVEVPGYKKPALGRISDPGYRSPGAEQDELKIAYETLKKKPLTPQERTRLLTTGNPGVREGHRFADDIIAAYRGSQGQRDLAKKLDPINKKIAEVAGGVISDMTPYASRLSPKARKEEAQAVGGALGEVANPLVTVQRTFEGDEIAVLTAPLNLIAGGQAIKKLASGILKKVLTKEITSQVAKAALIEAGIDANQASEAVFKLDETLRQKRIKTVVEGKVSKLDEQLKESRIKTNASKIKETTEVHGNVQPQPSEGMSAKIGGKGNVQKAKGRIQEEVAPPIPKKGKPVETGKVETPVTEVKISEKPPVSQVGKPPKEGKVKPVGRGVWASTIPEKDKWSYLDSLGDSYKGDNPTGKEAEKIEILLRSGRTKEVYAPYQRDKMNVSDHTGATIRHFINTPYGKAHPSELFPSLTEKVLDDIDNALIVGDTAEIAKRNSYADPGFMARRYARNSAKNVQVPHVVWVNPAAKIRQPKYAFVTPSTKSDYLQVLRGEGWVPQEYKLPVDSIREMSSAPSWNFLAAHRDWSKQAAELARSGGRFRSDEVRARIIAFDTLVESKSTASLKAGVKSTNESVSNDIPGGATPGTNKQQAGTKMVGGQTEAQIPTKTSTQIKAEIAALDKSVKGSKVSKKSGGTQITKEDFAILVKRAELYGRLTGVTVKEFVEDVVTKLGEHYRLGATKAWHEVHGAKKETPPPKTSGLDDVSATEYVAKIRAGDARSKRKGAISYEAPIKGPLIEKEVPIISIPKSSQDFILQSVNKDRVDNYARQNIKTPIYLKLNQKGEIVVSDGGHRLAAAIKRGDTNINALVSPEVETQLAKTRNLARAKTTPKVETPSQKDVQGATAAHADIDELRKEVGLDDRKQSPETIKKWVDDSKAHEGKERLIIKEVNDGDAPLSPSKQHALLVQLHKLRVEIRNAKKAGNEDAWQIATDDANEIADALDISGSRAGRSMRARQIIDAENYDRWSMERKFKKANMGEDLNPTQRGEFEHLMRQLEDRDMQLADKQKRIDELMAELSAKPPKPPRGSTIQRRKTAINNLSRLIPEVQATGGFRSKKTGAVQGTKLDFDLGSNLRVLAKTYIEDGAKTFDEIVEKVGEVTKLDRDQILYYLSASERKLKLEADIAKSKLLVQMNAVKNQALQARKSTIRKVGEEVLDGITTTQKVFGAGGEGSMALIQGRKLFMINPAAWTRGLWEGLKAAKGGEDAVLKTLTEIEKDLMFPRLKQAGYSPSEFGGPLGKQEEYLASRLLTHADKLPGLLGKIVGANPLTRAQMFSTAFMNKARYDSIKWLASFDPENPQFLKDVVMQVNILSGRGSGRVAESLSGQAFQNIAYAPRYYYSKAQYTAGQPLWGSKTMGGKGVALASYATHAAYIAGLMAVAKKFGWEVDTDIRSTNFGYAKIGDQLIDFFGKEADIVKFAARMYYGSVSEKGNFSAPGDYGNNEFERYTTGKASPVLRTLYEKATGRLHEKDDGTWEKLPLAWTDITSGLVPMTYRDLYEQGTQSNASKTQKWVVGGLQFFGENVKLAKPQSGKAIPPLDWKKPGFQGESSSGLKSPTRLKSL